MGPKPTPQQPLSQGPQGSPEPLLRALFLTHNPSLNTKVNSEPSKLYQIVGCFQSIHSPNRIMGTSTRGENWNAILMEHQKHYASKDIILHLNEKIITISIMDEQLQQEALTKIDNKCYIFNFRLQTCIDEIPTTVHSNLIQ